MRATALVGVYWVGVARMDEESSVEDEGARCRTQHEQRLDQPLWECGRAADGRRGSAGLGQRLIRLVTRRLVGVGAATGELKLKDGRLRLRWRSEW